MVSGEFEAFLEDTSHCFHAADFGLWRSRVRVPLCLANTDGSRTIKSEREAWSYFEECLTAMRAQGIDTIVRRPLAFDGCGDEVVLATYETHLFSGALRICDPFETTAMLRHLDRRLVASSLLNALDFSVRSRAHLQQSAFRASTETVRTDHARNLH